MPFGCRSDLSNSKDMKLVFERKRVDVISRVAVRHLTPFPALLGLSLQQISNSLIIIMVELRRSATPGTDHGKIFPEATNNP
jgi:hypothetical protein